MQEVYFQNKRTNERNAFEKIQNQVNHVVTLSEEQTKWWDTNFPVLSEKPDTFSRRNIHQGTVSFTPPAIREDSEVSDTVQLSTVDELNVTNAEISTSDQVGVFDDADAVDVGELTQIVEDDVLTSNVVSDVVDISADQSTSVQQNEQKLMNRAGIQINAWDPQTPYLKVLQYTLKGEEYNTYLKLKNEYGLTPAFYIDVSDFFSDLGKNDTAVTILSNLAELKLESPQLLRVLGNKLLELKPE